MQICIQMSVGVPYGRFAVEGRPGATVGRRPALDDLAAVRVDGRPHAHAHSPLVTGRDVDGHRAAHVAHRPRRSAAELGRGSSRAGGAASPPVPWCRRPVPAVPVVPPRPASPPAVVPPRPPCPSCPPRPPCPSSAASRGAAARSAAAGARRAAARSAVPPVPVVLPPAPVAFHLCPSCSRPCRRYATRARGAAARRGVRPCRRRAAGTGRARDAGVARGSRVPAGPGVPASAGPRRAGALLRGTQEACHSGTSPTASSARIHEFSLLVAMVVCLRGFEGTRTFPAG